METNKEALKFLLGLKLKDLRFKMGLSLKNLSSLSGLSSSYLNEIEKGKKYPTMEKLLPLAKGLKVQFEDLISQKFDIPIEPLIDFLKSDFFKELPFEVFGITPHELYELMGSDPEKFSSFILAISDMAKSYDLKIEDLQQGALRSYQERNSNYFSDIEEVALKFRKEYFSKKKSLAFKDLKEILNEKYKYEINVTQLEKVPGLETLRSAYHKEKKPALYLNGNLSLTQKTFVLAKELGYKALELERKNDIDLPYPKKSFKFLLTDLKASYFAGALLIKEKELLTDLKSFFKEKSFSGKSLLELITKYEAGTEGILNRMTQIIPQHMGLDQMFFLCFQGKQVTYPIPGAKNKTVQVEKYSITKELHLSQRHGPHGISLQEHYCRRWITVAILKELGEQMKQGTYRGPIVRAQKSKMLENGREYFCISVARPSRRYPGVNTCITIGLLMDEKFKRMVKFWNDPKVPSKKVSQTCERCPIQDCEDRVCPPLISQGIFRKEEKIKALRDFFKRPEVLH